MSECKRAAFRVHGRVQGVGFRWWCVQTAVELGLSGTVQNVCDGTVEIHLLGEVFAVDEMTACLAEGPRAAWISRLETVPPRDVDEGGFRVIW